MAMIFKNGNIDFTGATDILPPIDRVPEKTAGFELPPTTIVVSADTHYSVSEDLWFNGFPDHLKDSAPRVWLANGAFNIGFNNVSLVESYLPTLVQFETMPGCSQIESRLKDMDAEGVDKEIAYGASVMALMHCPDLTVREWVFELYNEHLAAVQERAPGRFYGVGLINYWDVDRVSASIDRLKALGLKTFMLPLNPGKDRDGDPISWHDDAMIPAWEAIEDAGLVVNHHIGEGSTSTGRGAMAIDVIQNFSPFRKFFGQYIFGGILDRHPKLQIAWAEGGINWAASAMQDAEVIYSTHYRVLPALALPIREYWERHMHATFMVDPIGFRLIDLVGKNKVMWASDYPHCESTWGYSRTAMQKVIDATSPAEARGILGGTALKLYGLDK